MCRLRLSSTSSSVAATDGGSSNEAGDILNTETAKKSENDRAAENDRVTATHFERSPTRKSRRSIQFSDTEVVNRTYESLDEVASKISFYKHPVTAQLPPTPRTGPPQLVGSPGMGNGVRLPRLGVEILPSPPQEQQRESVDEYIVMAPSLRR